MKTSPTFLGAFAAFLLATSSLSGQELLLHYDFDEADTGTAPTIDRGTATPKVDGRFFGVARRTKDTPGGASRAALDVTGGDGSILANHSSTAVASLDGKLDNLNQVTVTLWLNLQETPRNNDRIFSTGAQGIGFQILNPVGLDAESISASNFSLGLDTGDGTVPSYTNFDADKKWVFLAVTFDALAWGEEMVKFYQGDAEAEAALVRSVGTLARFATGQLDNSLRIGRHPSVNNREIEGFVDDFRIYSGVLSAAEIEAIRLENLVPYEEPAPANLVIHYNFDEAASGSEPAIDRGQVAPRVDGRFFDGATRTTSTPGNASLAALDVTAPESSVLANHSNPDVASLDGKLDSLSQFTVTLWLNLQANPRALDRIFNLGGSTGFGFRIVAPTTGTISASNFNLNLDLLSGSVASNVTFDADKKWLFVAATFDASVPADERVKFFSGNETAAAILRNQARSTTNATGVLTSALRLGRHATTADRMINGFIDDFRIYRVALTAEEIEAVRLENLGGAPAPEGFAGWASDRFSSAEMLDVAISGPLADPDGDGVANLLEYALGGNPRMASTAVLPTIGLKSLTVAAETASYLTLSFFRPDGRNDIDYIVESSSNLLQWAADTVHLDSTSTEGGFIETHRASGPVEQSGQSFLRLRVEQK